MAKIKNPLTIVQSGGGTLDNYGTVKYLDDNNVEQTLTLANEDDFLELASTIEYADPIFHINGVNIPRSKITEVTIADGVNYLPDYFLFRAANTTKVTLPNTIHYIGTYVFSSSGVSNELNLSNVISVGNNFLYNMSSYNQPVSLPRVEFIGNHFLASSVNFNSTVTINDSCKRIGTYFMYFCVIFAQSFSIPSGLEKVGNAQSNPGANFMHNCNNFVGPLVCNGPVENDALVSNNTALTTNSASAPLYTTGVTLTGAYAQKWKSAYGDLSSDPYRKLIVGS